MNNKNSSSSRIAEWQALVLDAENKSGYIFDENVESYVVFTLDHFTRGENWVTQIIAIDFLKSMEITGKLGMEKLRAIGDQCLLLSGLFPDNALKKNVSLGYFITIGQQAYNLVGIRCFTTKLDPQLFYKLSDNFIGIMDVLQTMRKLNPQITH